MPKKKVAKKQARTRRQPKPASGQARYKLTVDGRDPNFKYYWADEEHIDAFKERDYEMVTDDVKVGSHEDGKQGVSSVVMRSGGGGKQLYLMRIRKDYYKQDQDAADDEIRSREERIYNPEGLYQKDVSISRKRERFEE